MLYHLSHMVDAGPSQSAGVPARCSSPLIPDTLFRQSQQRAASVAGARRPHHSHQGLHFSYPAQRCGSPRLPAPLRLADSKPAGRLASDPHTVTVTGCTSYSTESLARTSTPHGPKYASRSAGSSPCHGAASTGSSSAAIAAAWLGQQETSSTSGAHRLTASAGLSEQTPHQLGRQEEATMDAVIKDPIAALMRESAARVVAAPAAASVTSSAGAGGNRAQPCGASSSQGVQACSRNHALQLEEQLQALPPGQLLAAQQQHLQAWADQQQQHAVCRKLAADAVSSLQSQQERSQHCELLSACLVPWQHQISQLMQQLTQQVVHHCVEHGRTLQALQERYAELASALFMAVACLSQHHTALTASAQATAAALAASQGTTAQLQQQLSKQQAAAHETRQELAVLTEQHEQLGQDTQQTIQQLQQLVVGLKQQLWQARSDFEQQLGAAEATAAHEADAAVQRVHSAEEAAADLRQRLAFVQAQLQALKDQQRQQPGVSSVAVQTDAEQQPSREAGGPDAAQQQKTPEDSSADTDSSGDDWEDVPDAPKAVNLVDYVPRGSKRSRLWLVKVLGQVTADKAVADAVADRQGVGRCSMQGYVPAWGLTRYGLQHLSDQVLADLCTSICHHAAAGVLPARWFACFCGLGPAVKPSRKQQQQLRPWQLPGSAGAQQAVTAAGTAAGPSGCRSPAASSRSPAGPDPASAEVLLGSAAAADFWVFCACQLAYPSSVEALFPEAREAPPLVRSNLVMESIKAALRYLGDPAGQAQFVSDKLDLAAVPAAAAHAAAAAGGKPDSSRPGTSSSSSVVGSFGYYNAWALLDLLLCEWLGRAWARAQSLEQLRRETAALQPSLSEQYAAAVAAASGSGGDGLLLRKLQETHALLLPVLGLADVGAQHDSSGSVEQQLLLDAISRDAEEAWRAYRLLVSLMQTIAVGACSEGPLEFASQQQRA